MPPTLILDTNVLVAGLRCSLGASYSLLGLVGQGRFTIGLTSALVLEYEAVCLRSLDALALSADDIERLLDYLCRVGKRAAARFRIRPSVADPGDEMVLEAAVATGSEWIVTHNVRDMAAGAARYGVEVITPGGVGMNGFQVELPAELLDEVARWAGQDASSESAWVVEAVREKLAACAELEDLEARATRSSREMFEQVLAKVPATEPVPGDER